MIRILFFMIAISFYSSCFAANITTSGHFVFLNGEIVQGDSIRFRELVSQNQVDTVVLNSPGGSLMDGLQIGETIRITKLMTYVPATNVCYSACGLIWIAGSERIIDSESKVGFHGAFYSTTHQATSDGNALIGSYLSRLHLSDEAIVFATESSPYNLNFITAQNAAMHGISVSVARNEHNECYEKGEKIVLSGFAYFNHENKTWYLNLDNAACVSQSKVNRIMVVGTAPPENTKIELTGTLFNSHNELALRVEHGRKIH